MRNLKLHWNNWGWMVALALLIVVLTIGLNAAVNANEVALYKLKNF
jgi:hypothetical protein